MSISSSNLLWRMTEMLRRIILFGYDCTKLPVVQCYTLGMYPPLSVVKCVVHCPCVESHFHPFSLSIWGQNHSPSHALSRSATASFDNAPNSTVFVSGHGFSDFDHIIWNEPIPFLGAFPIWPFWSGSWCPGYHHCLGASWSCLVFFFLRGSEVFGNL